MVSSKSYNSTRIAEYKASLVYNCNCKSKTVVIARTKSEQSLEGMVGLDIFFLAFISSASMNPERSLAPALLSSVLDNLWLYWTATLIGSSLYFCQHL